MADVKQMKNIVPFFTCEITFGQHVCKLMFGINVSNLNFRLSNNQSRATLWVRQKCLTVGLRPLIIVLITASLSSKTYNIALESESFVVDGILSMFVGMTLVCLIGMGLCMFALAIADGFLRSSLGSFCFVRYGMKYFNHQIPKSESGSTVHA